MTYILGSTCTIIPEGLDDLFYVPVHLSIVRPVGSDDSPLDCCPVLTLFFQPACL